MLAETFIGEPEQATDSQLEPQAQERRNTSSVEFCSPAPADAETTPIPSPSSKYSGGRRTMIGLVALLFFAGGGLLLNELILKYNTKNGTIEIHSNVADFEVEFDNKSEVVTIVDPNDRTKVKVDIPKGAKTLRVRKGGFEAEVSEFVLNTVHGPVSVRFSKAVSDTESPMSDARLARVSKLLRIGAAVSIAPSERGGWIRISDTKSLPDGQIVSVAISDPPGEFWGVIRECPGLSTLAVSGKLSIPDGKPFLDLPALKELRVESDAANDALIRDLADSTTLEYLGLQSMTFTGKGIRQLEQCKTLRRLRVYTPGGKELECFLSPSWPLEELQLITVQLNDHWLREISKIKTLTSLYLGPTDNSQFSTESFGALRNCSQLRRLELSGWAFKDQHLVEVNQIRLADLSLNTTAATEEGILTAIPPGLQGLMLQEVAITDTFAERIGALSVLDRIDFARPLISDQAIKQLSRMRPSLYVNSVRQLDLDAAMSLASPGNHQAIASWVISVGGQVSVSVDGEVSDLISKAEDLPEQFELHGVYLYVCKSIKDDDLRRLKGIPLRELHVDDTGVTNAGLAHVDGNDTLTKLSFLRSGVNSGCLAYFSEAPLEFIGLSGLNDGGMEVLSKFTSLKTIQAFRGISVTDAGMSHIVKLKNLEHLQLEAPAITDASLGYIGSLSQLSRLHLRHSGLVGTGFSNLTLPRLTAVGLSDSEVTDGGLATIAGFLKRTPSVVSLSLSNSRITDEGLKHLANCVIGDSLDLSNNSISDEGIRYLSDAKIGSLGLGDTNVTDEGLTQLGEVGYLYVSRPGVTQAGVATYKKRFPKAHIKLITPEWMFEVPDTGFDSGWVPFVTPDRPLIADEESALENGVLRIDGMSDGWGKCFGPAFVKDAAIRGQVRIVSLENETANIRFLIGQGVQLGTIKAANRGFAADLFAHHIQLGRVAYLGGELLGNSNHSLDISDDWHELELSCIDGRVVASLDGDVCHTAAAVVDMQSPGLSLVAAGNCVAEFKDLQIRYFDQPNPRRHVSEAILLAGGSVVIEDETGRRKIDNVAELPETSFRVKEVDLAKLGLFKNGGLFQLTPLHADLEVVDVRGNPELIPETVRRASLVLPESEIRTHVGNYKAGELLSPSPKMAERLKDPDFATAKWVLDMGAELAVQVGATEIKVARHEQLPTDQFTVVGATFGQIDCKDRVGNLTARRIRRLSFSKPVSDADMNHIGAMGALEYLILWEASDEQLKRIASLPKLSFLQLSTLGQITDNIGMVLEPLSLKELRITVPSQNAFQHLVKIKTLKSLLIDGILEPVTSFAELTKLNLDRLVVNRTQFSENSMQSLGQLQISRLEMGQSSGIPVEDMKYLAQNKRLRVFEAVRSHFAAAHLAPLRKANPDIFIGHDRNTNLAYYCVSVGGSFTATRSGTTETFTVNSVGDWPDYYFTNLVIDLTNIPADTEFAYKVVEPERQFDPFSIKARPDQAEIVSRIQQLAPHVKVE